MDDDTALLYGFVKISSYRVKAMKAMKSGEETPTQISKHADIRLSHISKVLREFKDRGIAVCINEQDRMNRIYKLTPLGWEIAEYLD